MRKIYSILLVAFFSFGLTQAQDVQKAKQILNKVSNKYKNFKSMKGDYIYTLEIKQDNLKETQKGSFLIMGQKFKITTSDQVIYCDGNKVYLHLVADKEVMINKYNPQALGINPSEIFTIYQKGYNYAYTNDVVINNSKASQIELTPKDKNKDHYKVKLFVDNVSNLIVKAIVYEKNSSIYTYEINNFKSNVNSTSKDFVFDRKSNANVVVTDNTK
jgi:outer membrane lipoprotein-sorting protein